MRPDVANLPDIFIPPHATAGALTLDYVEVEAYIESKRKISGKIVRILKHRSENLVGTAIKDQGKYFLVEKKSSRPFPLTLPAHASVRNGDTIIATRKTHHAKQMVVYARHIDPDSFTDCQEALLAEFGFERDFDPRVSESVAHLSMDDCDVFGLRAKDRVDLRRKAIVTIDGANARDFDDAVYAEKLHTGDYRLWISIADVSAFIAEHSFCDRAAYDRSTSTYFPGYALPMLPEKLSNDLCSLVPAQDRWTFTAEILLDADGTPIESALYPSIIHSKARLTYETVQRFFDHALEPEEKISKSVGTSLLLLKEIAEKMMRRRHARGSLDFDLPEATYKVLPNGDIVDIVRTERLFSHRLIEELMILANEEVAQFMERHQLPGLWRIHENPDPENLEHFLMSLKNYSQVEPADRKPIPKKRPSRHPREDNAEAAAHQFVSPKMLQGWIHSVRGKSYEPFMMKLLLRSLKQAQYREANVGHFGLASESYAHFTSPIRRYPDLYVHRLLRKFLIETASKKKVDSKKPSHRTDSQTNIAATVAAFTSYRERISMEAEREMNKLYAVKFIQDKLGQEFAAVISHTTPHGFYAVLDDYFVEGVIPKDILGPGAIYDPDALTWTCPATGTAYALGQRVTVQVVKATLYDRLIEFQLVN